MSEPSEKDCLNALTGRVIKSARWENWLGEWEGAIILETQDGLKFRIMGEGVTSSADAWVGIEQVENE